MQYVEKQLLTQGDYDLSTHAGGVKDIIDRVARSGGVKGILISCRLHKMHEIVLVAHQDCGAYGGSASFKDLQEERAHHIDQMRQARDIILEILHAEGEDCYKQSGRATDPKFILLWAHVSDDGTDVEIEDVTDQ